MSYPPRRTTIAPSLSSTNTNPTSISSSSTTSQSAQTLQRNRQYTHLAAQLAQLNANLADTENLLRMTSCQAEVVRGLGAWMGGLFMAASKVLGEEGVDASAAAAANGASGEARDNGGERNGY